MSGLHISLLTLRALISTTVCIYVWVCVCVQACLCMRGWINVCKSVSVYCMEVCATYTFVHMHVFTRVSADLSIHSPITSLTPGQSGLTIWVGRKRWEKDGESHLTVVADLLMCKNMMHKHTRRHVHRDVNRETWNHNEDNHHHHHHQSYLEDFQSWW